MRNHKKTVDGRRESCIIDFDDGFQTDVSGEAREPLGGKSCWRIKFMKTSNSVRMAGALAAVALLAGMHAQATVAYVFPGNLVGNQTSGSYILGNEFSVTTPINVNAVGAFDSGLDGFFSTTVEVAVYQLSAGSWSQVGGTFASFTGTAGTLDGSARLQNLTAPIPLSAGTYAIVAANYGAANAFDWNANLAPVDATPHPTFNGGGLIAMLGGNNHAFYANGSTLPSTLSGLTSGSWGDNWTPPVPAFAGGTFDFTPVPEAATFGAASVGLLGLVYGARHLRIRRKVPGA